jgi:hypothetical protein
VPAEVVCQALLNLSYASCSGIFHIAHPRPAPWSAVCEPLAQALELPLVSYDDWFTRLLESLPKLGPDTIDLMQQNPALKIVEFFKNARAKYRAVEAMGIPYMDVANAAAASVALQTVKPLTTEDALGWLEYWRQSQFI